MRMSKTLQIDDGSPKADKKEYESVLGNLQYLLFTQLDIIYFIKQVSVRHLSFCTLLGGS